MSDSVWIAFGLMFGGQLAWLIAAEIAKSWLVKNDPTYQREGVAARFFLGRLLTSFGPMARYARLRRERNEPTTLALVFWGGFAVSMLGLLVLLAMLAR